MAAPVIGTRPRYAPRSGATVDRTHPIAQNLEFCLAPGIAEVDLVTNVGAVRLGTPTVSATAFGPAGAPSSSTRSGWTVQQPDAPFLRAVSLMWVGRLTSFTASNFFLAKCVSFGSSQNPFELFTEPTSGNVTLYRANTLNAYFQYSTGVPINTDSVLILSSADVGSTPSLWINGGFKTAPAKQNTGTGAATGGEKPIFVGYRDYVDTTGFDGNVALACVWSRLLTSAEVAQLYADPFCFLKV